MIYFIENKRARAIKIGYAANDPQRRLRLFQTGSPDKLRMIGWVSGSLIDEGRAHARFATTRIRGEWFHDNPELREFIKSTLKLGFIAFSDSSRKIFGDLIAPMLRRPGDLPDNSESRWAEYEPIKAFIEAEIEERTGIPVAIAWLAEPYWSGAKGRPASWQIDLNGWDVSPNASQYQFWNWYTRSDDNVPMFPTYVDAADAFVGAWEFWSRNIKGNPRPAKPDRSFEPWATANEAFDARARGEFNEWHFRAYDALDAISVSVYSLFPPFTFDADSPEDEVKDAIRKAKEIINEIPWLHG